MRALRGGDGAGRLDALHRGSCLHGPRCWVARPYREREGNGMAVYLNASQHLGLAARVSIALMDVAEDRGIALKPKDVGALSDMVVRELLDRGEPA